MPKRPAPPSDVARHEKSIYRKPHERRLPALQCSHQSLSRDYVAAVRVNASFGRFFEPSPGRNAYVGLEIGGAR